MTMPKASDLMTERELRSAVDHLQSTVIRRDKQIADLSVALCQLSDYLRRLVEKKHLETSPAHIALAKAIDRALSNAGV